MCQGLGDSWTPFNTRKRIGLGDGRWPRAYVMPHHPLTKKIHDGMCLLGCVYLERRILLGDVLQTLSPRRIAYIFHFSSGGVCFDSVGPNITCAKEDGGGGGVGDVRNGGIAGEVDVGGVGAADAR